MDTQFVEAVAVAAAERVAKALPVLVAPTFPYGCAHYHLEFPGSMSLPTGPFIAAIEALSESPLGHGFRRLLLLNGHGGNRSPLMIVARNLHERLGITVGVASYWNFNVDRIKAIRESPPGGIAHACEFDAPETVREGEIVRAIPDYDPRWHAMDFYDPEPVHVIEDPMAVSPTGIFGDPELASAEKGAAFFEAVVDGVAQFLVAFASKSYREGPKPAVRGKSRRHRHYAAQTRKTNA